MIQPADFFELDSSEHRSLFAPDQPVWTALDRLPAYLASFFERPWPLAGRAGMVQDPLVVHNGKLIEGARLVANGDSVRAIKDGEELTDGAILMPGACLFDDRVIIGPRSIVEPGALIKGPTVIGSDVEVRQGAYMRGTCLVGNGCVVGHATEMKSSIMLDGAKAGHFAYIGNSILGRNTNLGAGTKLANLKVIAGMISISVDHKHFDTGMRKLGAILGDYTETGCNSVTSPGTLMRPHSIVYPAIPVAPGYYEESCVRLSRDSIEVRALHRNRRQ